MLALTDTFRTSAELAAHELARTTARAFMRSFPRGLVVTNLGRIALTLYNHDQ